MTDLDARETQVKDLLLNAFSGAFSPELPKAIIAAIDATHPAVKIRLGVNEPSTCLNAEAAKSTARRTARKAARR